MTANFLTFNPSETEFVLIGLPKQLWKYLTNHSLSFYPSFTTMYICSQPWMYFWLFPLLCRRNIQTIQRLSLPCPWPPLYQAYCWLHHSFYHCHFSRPLSSRHRNYLYYSLPSCHLHHHKSIQNTLARAVSLTPTMQSIHWLKIEQYIQYKVISITCEVLHNSRPTYLRRLITPRSRGSTLAADILCLCPPSITSRL